MGIAVQCACGKSYSVEDKHAGKKTRCKACGNEITIPAAKPPAVPMHRPGPPPRPGVASQPFPSAADEIPVLELVEDEEPAQFAAFVKVDAFPERPFQPRQPLLERQPLPGGTSGLAIASLVLAIPSFCFSVFTAIPAIVLGIVAINRINSSRGRLGGLGLAIAGITIGVISLPISLFFLWPAVQTARMSAFRVDSAYRMKNFSQAVDTYQNNHNKWPDRIEDLAPYVEGELRLKAMMRNPMTKDDPGYAYVRPQGDHSASRSQIVILQLQDGQPSPMLMAGFLDHTQRIPSHHEFADAQQRLARGNSPNVAVGLGAASQPQQTNPAVVNPVAIAPPPAARPQPPVPPPQPPVVAKTQLVGGFKGNTFEKGGGAGTRYVGFTFDVHPDFEGQVAIQDLVPYYTSGNRTNDARSAFARHGYVFGGLEIDADTCLNAVRVVFVRDKGNGNLDPSDRYMSHWLGKPTGRPTILLPQHGEPVAGIYGLRDQVITAIGVKYELPAGSAIPTLPPRTPPPVVVTHPKEQPLEVRPQPAPVVNNPPPAPSPGPLPITSVQTALAAAQEPDRWRNTAAAKWLLEIPREEVSAEETQSITKAIGPRVKSEDYGVRESFAKVFCRFAVKSDVDRLEEMAAFEAKYSNCWGPAVAALARLDPAKASRILELRLEDFGFRTGVVGELNKLGTSYEAAILPLLKSKKASIRQQAVDMLGDTGTKKSIPAIERVALAGDRKDQFFMKRRAETAINKIRQREELKRK